MFNEVEFWRIRRQEFDGQVLLLPEVNLVLKVFTGVNRRIIHHYQRGTGAAGLEQIEAMNHGIGIDRPFEGKGMKLVVKIEKAEDVLTRPMSRSQFEPLAPFLPRVRDTRREGEPRFVKVPEIKGAPRREGARPEACQFCLRSPEGGFVPPGFQTPAHPLPHIAVRLQEPLKGRGTDRLPQLGCHFTEPPPKRAWVFLREGNRLLLLLLGELGGTATPRRIVEAVKMARFPPIDPRAHAIPIDLVDIGDLGNRVPALAEQDRVRPHPFPLGRFRFHQCFELLPLVLRQRLREFGRCFHSPNILPQNFCEGA